MTVHNLPRITEVCFDKVCVDYYAKPRWLGGKPFKAIDQLSLVIDQRNIAIVGPSGAGKSTLIELLFGLRKPTSGEVSVCGYSLSHVSTKQRKELCRHIQLIPQEPQSSLNPYFTVRQILQEPLTNLGMTQGLKQRTEQAMIDVGLPLSLLEHYPQQLSVGQAQRVAIARSLVVEPCILVADEPTSSLDPVSRKQILDLFASFQNRKQMRVILVTHDLDAATALCDDILVLDNGRAVEYGSAYDLMTHPEHSITRALINAQCHHKQYIKTIGEVSYAT